jgi:hypothetical protein
MGELSVDRAEIMLMAGWILANLALLTWLLIWWLA